MQAIARQPARTFEDLIVWQKAHQLVLLIYPITAKFPTEERYHLAAQLRDAAVSVPANIAEGFKRRGQAEKARFANIAQGSLEEVRYFLRLSQDLAYGLTDSLSPLVEEVSKMLEAYHSALVSRRP